MKKILIVDDSKFMRSILKNILAGGGGNYSCSEASSGAEALGLLKTKKFDLILLDIIMKDNGIDTLIQILKNDKKAKVIMVTAVNQEVSIKRSSELGAKGYVIKPFDETDLLEKVAYVLGKR